MAFWKKKKIVSKINEIHVECLNENLCSEDEMECMQKWIDDEDSSDVYGAMSDCEVSEACYQSLDTCIHNMYDEKGITEDDLKLYLEHKE